MKTKNELILDYIKNIEDIYSKLNSKYELQNIELDLETKAKNRYADLGNEIVVLEQELNTIKVKLFGLLGEKQ